MLRIALTILSKFSSSGECSSAFSELQNCVSASLEISKITAIMVDMPDTARKNGYDTAIAFLEGLSNGLGNVNASLIGSANSALNSPKQKSQNNSGLGATIIPQTGTQNIVVQLTLDGKVITETVIKNINQQSYNQGRRVVH